MENRNRIPDAGEGSLGDMAPEEFREFGHAVIDWIAEYLRSPESYPVLSRARPGDIKHVLPEQPPEAPEPMEAVLQDFEDLIVPGMTHWNHPSFFAYFGITASGPGILGELLASALNVNAMLWKTSPAATELEEVCMDWLRQMIGLPDTFEGVITDTASVATLCAMVAAREALQDSQTREKGLSGRPEVPRLSAYASEQAHSSVEKAAIVMGIGQEGLRKVPADDQYRMIPGALREAIERDLGDGWLPFCVIGTVGTTSTTSIDPIPEIVAICREHGLWLHVDAAYAGSAAVVPEYRWVLDGCDAADSLVLNPHKWLFAPIDLSAFYCSRTDVLKRAFSLVPAYLSTQEQDETTNYMDYGIQLGRRFRALKLWFIFRYFGRQGIINRLREHVRIGQAFAGWVAKDPDFELIVEPPLSTVCFRYAPGGAGQFDQLNDDLMQAVNATGTVFLSHTRLDGKLVLRLAVGNIRTTEEHVARAWELLQSEGEKLVATGRYQRETTGS